MNALNLILKLGQLNIDIRLKGDKLKIDAPKSVLTPDLIEELKLNKDALTRFLQDEKKREKFSPVQPVEQKEYYALSSAQIRIYILQQMDIESTFYNMPGVIYLQKDLDNLRLERTFMELVQRHESLRTSFMIMNEEPVQKIHDNVKFEIDYYKDVAEAEVEKIIERFVGPFVLSKAPLLRVGLITTAEDNILLVDMHHIIGDGVSHKILNDEFQAIYAGNELPGLRLQYNDYAEWQNSPGYRRKYNVQEQYWLKEFSGNLPVLNLPTDFRRPVEPSFEGSSVRFELNRTETEILRNIAAETNSTLYMATLAVLNILLSKLSGQEDIIIGTGLAGRRHEDLQRIIGMFVNLLPLRNFPSAQKTCKEFLGELKIRTLEALENQDYPFDRLVDKLAIKRDSNRTPIFDVVFDLAKYGGNAPGTETAEDRNEHTFERGISKYDISFKGADSGENLLFEFEYRTKLFKRETMGRLVRYFRNTISPLGANREQKIADIEILSPGEREQVVYNFNNTGTDYPGDTPFHELFADQAVKTPDRIALVGTDAGSRERESLTYRELDRTSNRLARLLRDKGVGPDIFVGIMVKRSIEMIYGILGILKAGGAYLPLNPDFPESRVISMLEDCNALILLTHSETIEEGYSFANLLGLESNEDKPLKTSPRPSVPDLDSLPVVDRSLIDNEKYNKYIGHGMVKNSITLQATRGCPYDCAFCCRVWPKKLALRSAENIFAEVTRYYDMGIRRFVFIDDIFNFDIENSSRFFQLVIENNLDIQILFPSGLRGDRLTKEYIDLMVKAGTVSFPLSLETASPRLQKLIRKNLDLKKFRENIRYIIEKYPHVILELNTMHGFPTETKEEAMMTLDFIKRLKYVHFPYVHTLRIHANTNMEKLALENGVSPEAIKRSRDLPYHELPETLPFEKSFTLKYQAEFFNEYFLSKERLLYVLPWQMKVLTEDELVQKYNSYLPATINCFADLLEFVNIREDELAVKGFTEENEFFVPNLNEKMCNRFPGGTSCQNALRVLLLDLSQYYSHESEMLYDVVEQPLGLMYLMSYLKQRFGEKINGKIAKSRIDFDNEDQLKQLLSQFKPDVIGVRTLTMYRNFFHRTISRIKQWGFDGPIIAGGPYSTSDYETLLHDRNIDLAVMGEGEITFGELVEEIMKNGGKLPGEEVLEKTAGIAFIPGRSKTLKRPGREVIMLDSLREALSKLPDHNWGPVNNSSHLAYVMFTSGSTGKPKGVMVDHKSAVRLVKKANYVTVEPTDIVLQLSNYAFDGSVFDIFVALLNGARLVGLKKADLLDVIKLSALIKKENITIFFVTTALFNVLVDANIECFENIRHVLFGGERVSFEHVKKAFAYMGPDKILHVYGPTETTVYATYHPVIFPDETLNTVPIGKPLANTTVYILDKHMKPVPVGVPGEIFIGGDSVARGYLNRQELTATQFVANPLVKNEKLYKTGDLARWLPDGNVEFLGRIDSQLKLRGFRIELAEIETQLLNYDEIMGAVVLPKEDNNGDKYLCAYVIIKEAGSDKESGGGAVDFSAFRKKLGKNLPDYMIPAHFVEIEKIPLNQNGKVDIKALPELEFAADEDHIAPKNELERKLVGIWSEVLGINKEAISTHANFFELGGHSLKATKLASKIHKELNVRVPLAEIFNTQILLGLAEFIKDSKQDTFTSIEPAEKKEYYELSSPQKRLYIMQQMEPESTSYNIFGMIPMAVDVKKDRLEMTFAELIQRHEGMRTSFEIVNGEPVQKLHDVVDFNVEYHNLTGDNDIHDSTLKIQKAFLKPFDLARCPLLRVGLVIAGEYDLLLVNMHHIISDGTSFEVLKEDFRAVYEGKELPGLRLQYKDYGQWQNSETHRLLLKKQEQFWLKQFEDGVPVLDILPDFPRTAAREHQRDYVSFEIDEQLTAEIKKIEAEREVTTFIILLAVYYVLLAKHTDQPDIVIGIGIAGRTHQDLQKVIGLFVNMLPMRNRPAEFKTFLEFLDEVKQNALDAYENQDYQFDELVSKLKVQREPGRNPMFDTQFTFQNMDQDVNTWGLAAETPSREQEVEREVQFDLSLNGSEDNNRIMMEFIYSASLFKRETIEEWSKHYVGILDQIIKNKHIKLDDIKISYDLVQAKTALRQADAVNFNF